MANKTEKPAVQTDKTANLSRYTFEGKKAINTALKTPVAVQALDNGREFYRLTNDKGERIRLYLDEIVILDPIVPGKRKPSKLNMQKASQIRSRLAAGDKVKELAKEFEVNESAIYDIRSGRLYNDGSIVYTGKR